MRRVKMSEQEDNKPKEGENQGLSEEDYKKLNEDIEKTKNELTSEETKKKVEQAKEEERKKAQEEFEWKQKLAEQEKQNEELKKKLEETEKKSTQQLDALKKKVDDVIGTKMPPSQQQDPFASGPSKDVASMSDEQVDEIEESSAKAFFGGDYDRMLQDR